MVIIARQPTSVEVTASQLGTQSLRVGFSAPDGRRGTFDPNSTLMVSGSVAQ